MEVLEVNHYSFGLCDAIRLADCIEDGFQADNMFSVVQGPNYIFQHPVQPEYRNAYLRCRLGLAFRIWNGVRDVNTRSFVATKGGVYYAYVHWVLPRDYRLEAPWYHRLGSWVIKQCSRILDTILFIGESRPPLAPNSLKEMTIERSLCLHTRLTPHQRQALAHYSKDELAKTQYDEDDYTRCSTVVVRKDSQGRGVGSLLFQESIRRLEPLSPKLSDGSLETIAPPKLSLMSSPMGVNFYKKAGFRELGVHPGKCEGVPLVSTYMEMIYPGM